MDVQGQVFGQVAGIYHRSRPWVPDACVDWLTSGVHGEVLDLGAGTGCLTTQLLALQRFPRVHAVEPDRRMLTQLHRHCPDATVSSGQAEKIPLGNDSVGGVFVAGAWHWFDTAPAVAEIARVLGRGGTLGVVWNVRDRSVPWITQLDTIVRRQHKPGHEPGAFALPRGAPFGAPEQRVLRWEWIVSPEDLVLSLGTYSHVLDLPHEDRAAVLTQAQRFLTVESDLVQDGVIRVPIVTTCYRTRLVG